VIFKLHMRLSGLVRRRRLGEDGVSAVEFALIAPVLFIALLFMVDVGFAIYERMTIDYVLRAGAQAAMEDPGKEKVLEVLTATAAKNFSAANGLPAFKVNDLKHPWCECPENAGVYVACTTDCAGPTATSIYYKLESAKTYEGIFMSINLGPSMRVQVR
jgi:pilus assembly protein CpaE